MLESLIELDIYLLDLINDSGGNFLDQIMVWLSDKYIWIPLYAYLIFLLFQEYGLKFWLPLAVVLLVFAFNDQFTSSFMKPYFERLRPCKDSSLDHIVSIVRGCGGKYGFASSHAANTMGLAFIYFLLLPNRRVITVPLIIWSFWVGYSRVYLGVHYPGDVLVGFMVGIGAATAINALFKPVFKLLQVSPR